MRPKPRQLTHPDHRTVRLLEPGTIDSMPWRPVAGSPGVWEKALCDNVELVYALIRYEPGARTPGHPHQIADHHIWAVAGRATIAGRPVVAGSYVHVPVAVEHPVEDVGPDGFTMLQLHHRYPRC
ncbi:cupin domain-containing protein [Phytohabitans suffuscus]|uniref:ChrR-like cupin domain-containing protein n=1 Tax=Phytohabitans suffuscus TaxID=624315 RepID=A0A6F8YTZ3_9ACTN|nr:hypothetical protein [Phytohabitans suffuscus]BCB89539.1 hypothetical protein Psuf_068520 [Phytohabitans suffuscus]